MVWKIIQTCGQTQVVQTRGTHGMEQGGNGSNFLQVIAEDEGKSGECFAEA